MVPCACLFPQEVEKSGSDMASWRHPVPVPQARPLQGPQLRQAPGITDSALARVLCSEWRERIPACTAAPRQMHRAPGLAGADRTREVAIWWSKKPVSGLVGTPSGSDMPPWRHHQEVGILKNLMDPGACSTPRAPSSRLRRSFPRPPGSPIQPERAF
eukprot:gene14046-biopygen2045